MAAMAGKKMSIDTKAEEATPEFLESELHRLKKTFYSLDNPSRSYEYRIQQLSNLKKTFTDMKEEFLTAHHQDLGGSREANLVAQFVMGIIILETTIQNLKTWMADSNVETPLVVSPGTHHYHYEPLGVVCVLGCWNFPVYTCLCPVVSAIAAGNHIIIKPSEVTKNSERVMTKALKAALDDRCFSIVNGGPEVSKKLTSMKFDKMVFTGSNRVAKFVAQSCAKNLVPCMFELGGQNPTIIDEDANLTTAVEKISHGAFVNAGQMCIRPNTLYVSNKVKKKFLEMLVKEVQRGWGATKEQIVSKDFGLQVSRGQTERIVSYLKDHGGKVILGGDFNLDDRYVAPTLIDEPKRDSLVGKNEIFGPISIIYGYEKIDDVISEINEAAMEGEKPLALYYFGSSNAKKIENHTSSGGFLVNDVMGQGGHANLSFGGVASSGKGVYNGFYGFKEFSHTKAVGVKPSINPLAFVLNVPYKGHWKMSLLDEYFSYTLPVTMTTQWQVIKFLMVLGCLASAFGYYRYMN